MISFCAIDHPLCAYKDEVCKPFKKVNVVCSNDLRPVFKTLYMPDSFTNFSL